MNGCTVSRRISKGCPQGSVLGPFLWNIVFDELLTLNYRNNVFPQAYADDLVVVVSGCRPSQLPAAQHTIDMIARWCSLHKLELSVGKCQALVLLRPHGRLPEPRRDLVIHGRPIQWCDSIKVLGVRFDQRLSFYQHVVEVCAKVRGMLPRLTAAANLNFGFGYRALRTLYLQVVAPAIAYASAVWFPNLSQRSLNVLLSAQRPFLVRACRAFRSTSNAALISLSRVLLLDLEISAKTELYLKKYGLVDAETPLEPPPFRHPLPYPPYYSAPSNIPALFFHVAYYTDGSKTRDGVGAGVYRFSCLDCAPEIRESHVLSPHCSVFQAEALGLVKALENATTLPNHLTLGFLLDNLSAVKSVLNSKTGNYLIDRALLLISRLNRNGNRCTIQWIKGHSGNVGNDIADTLAKRGAESADPSCYKLAPLSFVKSAIYGRAREAWESRFLSLAPSIHTRFGLTPMSLLDKRIFQGLISTLQLVKKLDRYPFRKKRKIDSVEQEEKTMNIKKEATTQVGSFFVQHLPRNPSMFSGEGVEDPRSWLKGYERVAKHNQWDETLCLANVYFYLTGTALKWYENNEESIQTWTEFMSQLENVFGKNESSRLRAEKILKTRAQLKGESTEYYIQDVLRLCKEVDPQMNEEDKISHLMKGIAEELYQALIPRDVHNTEQFVTECRRIESIHCKRVTPTKYERLPNVASLSDHDDRADLSSMIRQIVREEVQRALGSTREEPKISTIEDMVKEEIGRTLAPISKPRRSSPQKERPREFYNNRYVAQTIRPQQPKQVNGRRDTNEWRTTEGKPICFHCGRPGHKTQPVASPFPSGKLEDASYFGGKAAKFINPPLSTTLELKENYIDIKIEGKMTRALVDSGASYSVISERFRLKLRKIMFAETDVTLRVANGKIVRPKGRCTLKLDLNGLQESFEFVVLEDCSHEVILGWNFLKLSRAIIDSADDTLFLEKCLFEDTPKNSSPLYSELEYRIEPASIQLIEVASRDIPNDAIVVAECRKELLLERELTAPSSVISLTNNRGKLWVVNWSPYPKLIPQGMHVADSAVIEDSQLCTLADCNQVETEAEHSEDPKISEFFIDDSLDESQKEKLRNLLKNYTDIFEFSKRKQFKDVNVKHRINTGDHLPTKQRPYRVAPRERQIIQDEVNKMEKLDIIQPSESPWASPVVLIRKKDGSWRFCVDYRRLNKITKKDVYPLPRIDDTLDCLRGARFYSSMDLQSGYWQIDVEESDREKTAFITPDGLYEFKVMPFGLCNAPATFERMIDNLLKGLKWTICLCYLDDIIVFSDGFEEHLRRLQLVSENGIRPDQEKIRAVRDFATPRSLKEVRSFLGLSSYYRRFIPNYAHVAQPLNDLLKKDSAFNWNQEEQNAFEALKSALISEPALGHFDYSSPTEIHTDASNYGIGAVLVQIQKGKERAIAYASRTLNKAEKNYSTTERECLAIIWAINKFRPYVFGQPFTIVTDHHSLCWLTNLKDPCGRLARWALRLQEFDVTVVYKSGRKHQDADCLSRSPLEYSEDMEEDIPSIVTLQNFSEEQMNDQAIRKIADKLQSSPNNSFVKIDNTLYRKNYDPMGKPWLLVVPRHLRQELLKNFHDSPTAGHLGFTKTYDRIRKKYYWPGMYRTVRRYVAHCSDCQRRKHQPQLPSGHLQPIPVPEVAFEKVGMDLLGRFPTSEGGNRWIIVCTDYLTKYAITKALPTSESMEVAKFFIEDVILKHGAPRELITDRGRNFTSSMISDLNNQCRITHRKTTAYHPQTNGLTERLNKTIADMLSMYVDVNHKDWDRILPFVTFAYNTAKQESTGFTPFFLVHGREAETPLDVLFPKLLPEDDDFIQTLGARAEEARKLARIHSMRSQGSNKHRYDAHHRNIIYQPGDLVWIFIPVRKVGYSEKLMRRYFGPYKVTRKISDVTYEVETFGNQQGRRKTKDLVHIGRMKPYLNPEDQEDQLEEDPEDDSTNFQEEDIPTERTQQPQTREEISGPITRSRALRLRIDTTLAMRMGLTFPVPAAADLQVNLAGGRVFSKLDLKDAYQQLVVDEETAELLAINTHKGLFKVNRLPFGVSCAPGIFQRQMESLIAKIPGVVVYLDDILVTGKDEMEHDLRLREVLKSIQRMGLTLKKEKCEFKKSSLIFLGCRIDAEGIHPTEEKCEAIKNFPKPENKKELQSFLGLLNFYSKFLKDRTTVLEPLHRLLNKRNCWKWKEVEDRAFREAKNLIQSDLVLTPYDARKPLVLACDASPFGVGAVLSHVEEGIERPIAFASRTISQTERRYAQIDKEALAIIFGISKFYKYLYGRDFKIITDHKPLLGIFNPNKPIPQMLSQRMMRWSLTLASYSYQIEHRTGRMNANADALSRAPHEKTSKETPEPVDVFLMETNEESPLEVKEVAKLTQEDSVLGIIVEWTRIGWPAHCPAEKFRPYFNRRNELSLHRECLLWGNRVVIPPVLQRRTMEQLHETHPGIVQMKAIARSHVWWPGMDKAIENRVKGCENCQLVRNNPKPSPVHPWTAPVKPWSRIHIDYAGPFHGRTFLIVVDSMSKWPEAIIMDHCTATATVQVLRNLFAVHGLPDQVVSDNGRMFVGHEFQEFLMMNGLRHITSAPYHPQTNGQAERVVQTLKQLIRKNGWENISVTLPRALFAMRTTPHGTTGLTPAELLMGRRLTTRMNRLHPKESEDSENGKEHFQNRFKSQENVYARKYNGKGKWEPGKIKTVLGPRNYEVIMENGVTAKRHQDQLMRRVKEEVSEDVEKKEECNTERRGEQMNDPNESQERLEETPGPSRPIRNRRLPEYLKDCVTNWGPSELALHGNVAENWRRFKQRLMLYLEATEKATKPDKLKVAILLNFIGEEALEVFNTFHLKEDEAENFDLVINKFDDFCEPKKNVIFERFKFFSATQKDGESIDSFITELKGLSTSCEFESQKDSLIRDRIVYGIQDKALQERLLREPNLTLIKAIEMCKTDEISKQQIKIMQNNQNICQIRKYEKKHSPKQNQESEKEFKCQRCGKSHRAKNCPAWGKRCSKCKKMNHFAAFCKGSAIRSLNDETEETVWSIHEAKVVHTLEWKKSIIVNGKEICFKLDSGAEVNVLPYTFTRQMKGLEIFQTNRKLTSYTGHEIKIKGIATLNCKTKNKTESLEFFIADGYYQPILGIEAIEKLSLIKKCDAVQTEQNNSAKEILNRHKNIFEGIGRLPIEHKIRLKENATPVIAPSRKIPFSIREKVKAELERMEKLDIIEKVEEPNEWTHPIVVVQKPSGDVRICMDPRELNKYVQRERYILPTAETIFSELKGATVFSVFDASSAFWQVPLDKESTNLCTIATPFGRFRFKRLPYGLNSASEVFQRCINNILSGLQGTACYMDDILIYGNTMEEHNRNLETVLRRLEENNVKLNAKKQQIAVNKVNFLGHIISRDGIAIQASRAEAIQKLKRPENKTEVQRFLGMVTYLGKFIPNLSDKTAPLRKLISNKSEWKFGGEENDCFEKLKNMVSNAPILTFFDPTKPITISSDASQYGIGTVLMQGGQAIEYASFSLNATQRKYAQIEKELLAIVFGCERFQYYIWGNDVIVETDHKPLLSIVKKPLEKLSPRLQRMVLRLMRFQISLKFTPGKNMFVADHLSRDPLKDEVDTSYLEGQTESVHMLLVTTDEKIKRLQKETHGDHTLIQLIEYAKNGWPKYKTKVCDEAKPYWQFQDEIHVSDGIVYKGNCIMVPSTLRKEILQVVHSSHQGIAASKEKARSAFYWPGMITQVENEVEKCRTCQEYSRKNPEESRIAHEIPEFPWEKIAVDFMEVSGTSSILVVDYHSKFVEIRKLSSKRETETILQLKTIFRTHGIPRTLVSDNGPPFNSTGFKNFAQKYEFKHQTSSPKYPRSNGQVERTIQTIKGLIIKAVKSGRDPNLALMEFNNTPKYDLPSPTQMLMGRSVRTLSTYTRQQLKPLFDTTKNYQKLRDHQQKYAGSPKRILRPLEVGDNIMLQERHRKWVPATVTAKHETPRSYMVKTPSGSEYRRNRSHLRPRKFSVEDSAPTSQSPSIPGSQAGTAMDDNIQDHGRPTSENRRAYDPRENVAKKGEESSTSPSVRTRSGRT
ncbi:K02A2.6-like, partial [Cordylochernes scorpioides]